MAKRIEWTETGIRDRYSIYNFWLQKTKNSVYSEKLEALFKNSALVIAEYPELGVPTNVPSLRVKIVKEFKLFYMVTDERIKMIRDWDSRRDPDKMILQ